MKPTAAISPQLRRFFSVPHYTQIPFVSQVPRNLSNTHRRRSTVTQPACLILLKRPMLPVVQLRVHHGPFRQALCQQQSDRRKLPTATSSRNSGGGGGSTVTGVQCTHIERPLRNPEQPSTIACPRRFPSRGWSAETRL